MELRLTSAELALQREVGAYLTDLLAGEFAAVRGRGGLGSEDDHFDERLAFERRLARDGWTCVGWPTEFGGRGLSLSEQIVYHEQYARAGGPERLGHIGESLLGPTLIHFGSQAQQRRFLEPIRLVEELWCQGYSEPDAGSDLASLSTRAVLDGDEWVITGQKVWTSLAHRSDWCFVLARTDPGAPRHRGISFLLVPLRAPGVDIRPIVQLTGAAEFNEIFFTGARTARDLVVGEVNGGWKVGMGLLSFERGLSTLDQQMAFSRQLEAIRAAARANGRSAEQGIRQRIGDLWGRLQIMRWNTLRVLSTGDRPELSNAAYITKLYWARFHQELGELFADVVGNELLVLQGEPPRLSGAQRLHLSSRADSIYGGTDQIQLNLIGERALGLPRDQ